MRSGITAEIVVPVRSNAHRIPSSIIALNDNGTVGVLTVTAGARRLQPSADRRHAGRPGSPAPDKVTIITVGRIMLSKVRRSRPFPQLVLERRCELRHRRHIGADPDRLTTMVPSWLRASSPSRSRRKRTQIFRFVFYISIVHHGISPEDSERLLIRPMETELRSLEGLKELRAIASQAMPVLCSSSTSFDRDSALQDVREKVDMARPASGQHRRADDHGIQYVALPVLVRRFRAKCRAYAIMPHRH